MVFNTVRNVCCALSFQKISKSNVRCSLCCGHLHNFVVLGFDRTRDFSQRNRNETLTEVIVCQRETFGLVCDVGTLGLTGVALGIISSKKN